MSMKARDEVIQALKCCLMKEDDPCEGNCPYAGEDGCVERVMYDALLYLED